MARAFIAAAQTCALVALLLVAIGRPTAGQVSGCAGDCDHNQLVTVDELVTGVSIALGSSLIDLCPALNDDQVEPVTVDQLVRAVDHALTGCPAEITTPTPTETSTVAIETASPTATEPLPTESPAPTTTSSPSPVPATATDSPAPTATPSPTLPLEMPTETPTTTPHGFCDLPGSVQTTANGIVVVPGGPANSPNLSFLHLPVGFCAHFFANVGNTRQLRFAPGGELFVASPTTGTTGGGTGGQASIMVLPDDDHDGAADTKTRFLSGMPSTQGLLFANGYLYYQNGTKIMRVPYANGDRTPSGGSEQVANITLYTSGLHWPKTLDIADDGTIYVGNGGDQGEACITSHPFHGGVLKLDGPTGGTPVAKGFRNPISVRCSRGHNLCLAIELARDYTADVGGREKIAPIRDGDDWGFPCCATKNLPFPDIHPTPDCSAVASESASFLIGDTPFDLDFETGKWPAPWNNRVYVPLHGAYGTWSGARVVAIAFDPTTGNLLPGSDVSGHSTGALADFATGWANGTFAHGRPANVAFAPDGRLFLGNDNSGDIVWIAPMGL